MHKSFLHSELNSHRRYYSYGYTRVESKPEKKKEEKVFETIFTQSVINMWKKYFSCRG